MDTLINLFTHTKTLKIVLRNLRATSSKYRERKNPPKCENNLGYCCAATRLRSRLISTSLGSLRQRPSSFEIILDVCKSLHLPRFQVIEIGALSIRKNVTFYHQSVIDVKEKILFRVESHVFAGEEY